MAIAWDLLLTRPPLPPFPDFSVPCFRRVIALLTDLPAAFPYLAIVPPVFLQPIVTGNKITSGRCARDFRLVHADQGFCVALDPFVKFLIGFGHVVDRIMVAHALCWTS